MFLIFGSPSLHGGIGLNEEADITIDVLPLAAFFMERHSTRWGCQRVKSSTDVLLGPTSDNDE